MYIKTKLIGQIELFLFILLIEFDCSQIVSALGNLKFRGKKSGKMFFESF